MPSLPSFAPWLRKACWALTVSTSVGAGSEAAQTPAALPTAPAVEETPPVAPGVPASTDPTAVPCEPCAPKPNPPRWQTPVPRGGYFAVFPTGPGYYTALDHLRGNELQAPPKYPYPRISPIFIPNSEVNWSYLKDPNNTQHDYADFLKFIPIGSNVTFTTGGEFRYRYMNEFNSNTRDIGARDAYNMFRQRLYGDLWVQDWLRFYAEGIYSDVTARSIAPVGTDIDRGDFLDLFVEARVFQFGEKNNPVYARVGRQEMVYGSQRLISALDWPNTRRTFDGAKLYTRTEKWDFDVFAVSPVLVGPTTLDTSDHNQLFSGAWYTYRNAPGQNIDLYFLNLDNDNRNAAVGNGGVTGNYNVSTFGLRSVGNYKGWLWDFEPMLQTGHYSNQSILAKAVAVDGGYSFTDAMWSPQLWAGYEYASGDPNPQASGTRRTFNQLFPFGHYYFGQIDLVGRQNINDFFLSGYIYPQKWLTMNAQYHVLRLDSDKDALYGPGGNVVRQDKTGKAGDDVGNLLTVTGNIHFTNHSDLLVGGSYMWAGNFLKATATTPAQAQNPTLFYMQYSYRW